jgi:hypothetical protein
MSMAVRFSPGRPPMVPLVPEIDFIKVTFFDFAANIQNSQHLLSLYKKGFGEIPGNR